VRQCLIKADVRTLATDYVTVATAASMDNKNNLHIVIYDSKALKVLYVHRYLEFNDNSIT
jgi:hypothetical protein